MSTLSRHSLMTPEEFEFLPNSRALELIDGEVREKKMGTETGSVISRIAYYLMSVVLPARLGEVIVGDGMYRCFPSHPKRVRKPDLSFILRERLPEGKVPLGITNFRPDLAVEVVSPRDIYYEVDDKLADFFDAGIPLIWIVSPFTQTVVAYHLDGTCRRLRANEELTAHPLISDFRVRIADLFPNPLGSIADAESLET